jgi:hypothetical protein
MLHLISPSACTVSRYKTVIGGLPSTTESTVEEEVQSSAFGLLSTHLSPTLTSGVYDIISSVTGVSSCPSDLSDTQRALQLFDRSRREHQSEDTSTVRTGSVFKFQQNLRLVGY